MDNKEKLSKLVQRFEEHLDDLKHKDYKEMQLCTDYINPLFAMLGWDIENERDSAEKFRDVVQQYRLAIGGTSKAPDYLFRIGGTPVFFVEAKKPSVDINSAKDPAFQLRRYGWNKKEVDISILTDFEDFSVYNCQIKPQEGDEPHVGRIARYTYKQYLTHWEEIESMFSRASVERGSLDKLLKEKSIKGIKETVDESFLKMIEDWRDMLARNLALRNPELDVKQLNYAVQQTIDRIIFLRIAEDRGIEEINQLLAMTNGSQIYGRLIELFKLADQRYNSGLFHFVQEKAIKTPPDNLSLTLSIDDKVLKDMIVNLYPPKSPYDFSAMPADILGQVYERFLGKVIRLTDGHRAVVDEKPEVRKAGGVYYTPTYIVDYIVQNTVGKLVEGKTPAEVAKLRILDPACGSGSFLIGAYQFLLDWHIEYYKANDPEKHAKGKNPPICQLKSADGSGIFVWKLTTEKRKEILLNNIYGVDIDRQAVEVTKLNLLLKVLEEAHVASLFEKFQRALPDLGSNIKCGNSLIESDFYAGKHGLFDTEEMYRINTFDWDREFPDIIRWKNNASMQTPQPPLKKGGPDKGAFEPSPSGRRCLEEADEGVLKTFKNEAKPPHPGPLLKGEGKFRELAEGFGFDAVIGNPPYGASYDEYLKKYLCNMYNIPMAIPDSFLFFVLRSLFFIKANSLLSFIIPTTWIYMPYYTNFRKNLIISTNIMEIRYFKNSVFSDATVETSIVILRKSNIQLQYNYNFVEIDKNDRITLSQINIKDVNESNDYSFSQKNNNSTELFNRLRINYTQLKYISLIICGLTPYRLGKGKPPQDKSIVDNRAFDSDIQKDETYKQYIMGRDFKRYCWSIEKERFLSYGDWLAEPRRAAPFFDHKKIIIRQTSDHIVGNLDTNKYLSLKNVHNIRITNNLSYEYLLGILNSRLLSWWYQLLIPEVGRVFAEVKVVNLEKIPIKEIDFNNKKDVERHDAMVHLVEQMLELNKRLQQAKTPDDKELLSRQIEATDRQIDGLVYELYELTPEEIALVEESSK